jgi:phenylalanyl-tRNA synthetase beta chain
VTTYRGKQLEKGRKSVTISLSFRSPNGTLTGGEIDAAIKRVVDAAGHALAATVRM